MSIFTENDTIYWVDMGLSTISRAKRDQTWREDVVTNGIGRVEGIAVDWIAGEWRLRRENYSESSKEAAIRHNPMLDIASECNGHCHYRDHTVGIG